MSTDEGAPTYHDVHVTTEGVERTSIFNLPYGYELSCNRVGGWNLRFGPTQVAGEYDKPLRIDVAGVVICDSFGREVGEEA